MLGIWSSLHSSEQPVLQSDISSCRRAASLCTRMAADCDANLQCTAGAVALDSSALPAAEQAPGGGATGEVRSSVSHAAAVALRCWGQQWKLCVHPPCQTSDGGHQAVQAAAAGRQPPATLSLTSADIASPSAAAGTGMPAAGFQLVPAPARMHLASAPAPRMPELDKLAATGQVRRKPSHPEGFGSSAVTVFATTIPCLPQRMQQMLIGKFG